MTGTALPSGCVNLANGTANSEIVFPPDNTSATAQTDLNTSLWSISGYASGGGSQSLNAVTINMQAVDKPGTAGTPAYYAIRVNTDSTPLLFGNIRLTATQISQ
jgi:hypothetical protein